MNRTRTINPILKRLKSGFSKQFSGNASRIIRFLITGLFIVLAVWFFNHEKTELQSVGKELFAANPLWVIAGIILFAVYIFLQALMYVYSFAAVNAKIGLWDAVILFLKRNFISVFIPAGGISSLAFFGNTIEKKGVTKSQIYFASSIYAFVGILSVIMVAIPVFLFAVSGAASGAGKWLALGVSALILFLLYGIYKSLLRKKYAFRILTKIYPDSEVFIDEMINNKIRINHFINTILVSVIIEFAGIAHVYISMAAINLNPSLSAAVVAYIIVVLFLIISPFLRGLGAIEVSMSYILMHSGFSNVDSIAITILFRFFEFWLPLVAGVISFLVKIEKLLLRIVPSLLIFSLGIINIISVLSPATPIKLQILRDYLFFDVVNFSNSFVLVSGLFLLVTATFMLKGLRSAWMFAVLLSLFSAIGHITKGINYPEAGLALFVVLVLFYTRKEYYVKTNPRIRNLGIQTALLSVAAVLIYGITGFYFLDKNHFQTDFNIFQSVKYTFQNFFLIGSGDLVPGDSFASDFLYTIKVSGFASITFVVYSLIRPYVFKNVPSPDEKEKALKIVKQYGRSSLDYFKTYYDKQLFILPQYNSFISYKITGNFAVVLENPVSPDRNSMKQTVIEFKKFCYNNGLKELYYRVPLESLDIYSEISRKSLFLGQEGIVDISAFTLEGGEKKSIRNAINKITEQGYLSRIHLPPLKDGLILKLKAVSDEWLELTDREEIVFSQGLFSEKEIKEQTVMTVENKEEKIIAFLNFIPDYANNEGTYDLLRKTSDAPNGIIDFVTVEMFKYFRNRGIQFVNLGFAPMAGIDDPHNFPEKSMKYAYEKFRSFSHFKGQREYKEKFGPVWFDKYLIYDNDFDLISVPSILTKIIKP